MASETRKRTPEQVHEEDGHATAVKSCSLCTTEAEVDRQVAQASTRVPMVAGRPKCYLEACELPEYDDNVGLCGGHWANRPDLRKVARRG